MVQKHETRVVDSVWLSPKAASAYTSLDEQTLRRAVRAGKLTAFAVNGGTRIRYRRDDLDAYLGAVKVQS